LIFIGELFPEKNQQFEIFNFTKVMAKKVKNFGSFFEKVTVVNASKAQNKTQILKLQIILRRNGPTFNFFKKLFLHREKKSQSRPMVTKNSEKTFFDHFIEIFFFLCFLSVEMKVAECEITQKCRIL
jgi:hypothetical protein